MLPAVVALVAFLAPASAAPTLPPPAPRLDTGMDLLPVVLAAAVGAGVARVAGRARSAPRARMARLGSGAGFRPFGEGLPGTGDGPSVWSVPDADGAVFARSLAHHLAARGPVLLLPRPQERGGAWATFGPGVAPVWMLEAERPSAKQVVEALAELGEDGRMPVVVVDGPGALEHAASGRAVAALEELLRGAAAPVFAVVGDGVEALEGRVVVHVRASGEGWIARGANGEVALAIRDGVIARAEP